LAAHRSASLAAPAGDSQSLQKPIKFAVVSWLLRAICRPAAAVAVGERPPQQSCEGDRSLGPQFRKIYTPCRWWSGSCGDREAKVAPDGFQTPRDIASSPYTPTA